MEKGNVFLYMKKMEKEWMKLIDDVENDRSYNTDPIFNFLTL